MSRTLTGLVAVATVTIMACGNNEVAQEEYGDDWPLTIPKVTLHCLGDAQTNAVWVEANGTKYPLTGFSMTYLQAQTEYQTISDINSIRRPDPSGVGLMSIDALRDRAQEKC